MQNITPPLDRPVSHLAVTWVLMIPLAYFSMDGVIRFNAYTGNNDFDASFNSLIPSQSNGPIIAALVTVFSICSLLFCTKLRGLISVARNNKIFVVLSALTVVSAGWSQFPKDSLQIGTYATINMWFAFYLTARFTPVRQMQLFVTLGWVVTVTSIFVALLFPQYGMDHQEGAIGAWIGIFPHKNWCSIMVAFLLSPAFYMRPSSSPLLRFARIAYIVLSLLLIVMSQARTGWIVAAFLLVYVAVTKHLKRYTAKDGMCLAILFGAAAVVAGIVFDQYYSTIMVMMGKDPTLTGRTKIWSLVIGAIWKRPVLGYGYRAFWHGLQGESGNLSLAKGWIIPAAHNGFLDLWLGLGAVGVGLVVYSILQASRNALKCLRGGGSPSAEWYLCIVFVTLISNVAELTLMVPNYLAWIMYIVACVGLSQEAKRIPSAKVL